MFLRTIITSISCLYMSLFSSSLLAENVDLAVNVSPYYQVEPAMILDTINSQTQGKIASIQGLKMYLGNDSAALQFCTPDVDGDEFIFGIIRFSRIATTVDWAELTLKKEDTAPFICDAIAQEGEPVLIEFYLSDIVGMACMENSDSISCRPFI